MLARRRVQRGRTSSSSSIMSKSIPHHMTKQSDLNQLFDSKVVAVQKAKRPLSSSARPALKPLVGHVGVVVTLENGKKYLLHKTPVATNPGNCAVVVDAKHMEDDWNVEPPKVALDGVFVGQLVRASGGNYVPLTDNCYDAMTKVWNIATGESIEYSIM